MRTTITTATTAGAALLLATLTACSTSHPAATHAPAAPATHAAATPKPSPTPTKASTLTFGTAHKSSGSASDDADAFSASTIVLGYEQPIHTDESAADEINAPGNVWAALDVKVCDQTGDIFVNNQPWQLSYPDGSRIAPSGSTYSDFPQPEYPAGDTAVPTGSCVRGKIVFNVPGKKRPTTIVYSTADESPVVWSVPAA